MDQDQNPYQSPDSTTDTGSERQVESGPDGRPPDFAMKGFGIYALLSLTLLALYFVSILLSDFSRPPWSFIALLLLLLMYGAKGHYWALGILATGLGYKFLILVQAIPEVLETAHPIDIGLYLFSCFIHIMLLLAILFFPSVHALFRFERESRRARKLQKLRDI